MIKAAKIIFCKSIFVCVAASFFLFAFFAHENAYSKVQSANEIYVYSDKGACEDGCVDAVNELLETRGEEYLNVQKSQATAVELSKAKLWISPGGDGIEMATHLTGSNKKALREFVAAGGSYLGICAGAFLADHFVDNENTLPGLGLVPGVTRDFSVVDKSEMILPLFWNQILRYLYFQDGATFDLQPMARVQTLARYANGEAAVIEFMFGKGKVILSGVHPEATESWRGNLFDPDGDDTALANELLDRLLLH